MFSIVIVVLFRLKSSAGMSSQYFFLFWEEISYFITFERIPISGDLTTLYIQRLA